MGYKVKLSRLGGNGPSKIRTNTAEGQCEELPRKGECFLMTAKPIDPQATIRLVKTSEVVGLILSSTPVGATYQFKTKNSEYELQVAYEEEVQA